MEIFFYNITWMSYNVLLALIPVVLAFLMIKAKNKLIKIVFILAWFAFLPNTIYMITDINHLLEQWGQINAPASLFVFSQYVVLMFLAVVTFIAAQYPFEIVLNKQFKVNKQTTKLLLILVDFFVAFGVILGGIERVNSWELLTDPMGVMQSTLRLFHSLQQMWLLVGFGVLFSIIYFSFRHTFYVLLKKVEKK